MSKRTTFFTVDRKLLESELWLSEPFTKGQAWVDLIGRASYEDGDLTKRGQLLISERGLAKRWKWTRGRVRWFLQRLEKNGMIAQTSQRTTSQPTQGTTLTIENYDKYQSAQPKERPKERPTSQPLYNNINNITNISLNMPDGIREELQTLFGDRTEALIEDVERYYSQHPEKTFPGWKDAMLQFNANQKRWGGSKKKHEKTTAELAAEMFGEETT